MSSAVVLVDRDRQVEMIYHSCIDCGIVLPCDRLVGRTVIVRRTGVGAVSADHRRIHRKRDIAVVIVVVRSVLDSCCERSTAQVLVEVGILRVADRLVDDAHLAELLPVGCNDGNGARSLRARGAAKGARQQPVAPSRRV